MKVPHTRVRVVVMIVSDSAWSCFRVISSLSASIAGYAGLIDGRTVALDHSTRSLFAAAEIATHLCLKP